MVANPWFGTLKEFEVKRFFLEKLVERQGCWLVPKFQLLVILCLVSTVLAIVKPSICTMLY